MISAKLDSPTYGIFSVETKDIHRDSMTYQEAVDWMNESKEAFPDVDVWSIWGIWKATPVICWGLTDYGDSVKI